MEPEYLIFAEETARAAGEIIRSRFGHIKTRTTKEGRGDIVTDVDTEVEALVLDRVRRIFPGHNIVSEESGAITGDPSSSYTWYIDPLDGTGNYARGIPFCATTIALARDNIVIAGATYDPLRDEMFSASLAEGAHLNGQQLQIAPDNEMEDIMISLSWSRRRPGSEKFAEYVKRLHPHTSYLRRFGSAALAIAYVAAGRIEAYVQGQITPWDIATGILLVQEAGGRVTDFKGKPVDLSKTHSDVLAANTALHERLLREMLS
jgi:myo-inositol-1(or 4)-monophosphatase